MKVLHLDTNHPLLIDEFSKLGFENQEDYTSSKEAIEKIIHDFDGVIIRSRFPIDEDFLEAATNLKFIGRVGAGLENIDTALAKEKNIFLANAPEGNRNAVAEHNLGMLLSLMNHLYKAHREVRKGEWDREGNRGVELDGKTIGIIGYGNTGKAFAKKLQGFDVEVICYDIDFFMNKPKAFKYLRKAKNVLMTPHVAGWTHQSKEKLAQVIVDKIKTEFC